MEERIPARITEWICNQTGTPCGSENKSTVSTDVRAKRELQGVPTSFRWNAF